MATRSGSIHSTLLGAALLALVAACAGEGDEEPRATREGARDACVAYEEVRCRKVADCRGEESIDGCLSAASERCDQRVEELTCWEGLREGYEACLDVEDAVCEDLCDEDGVCIDSCFFECPVGAALD